MGGGWSAPRRGRFSPWKDPVTTVQEAGWATGPVWTGAQNLAPQPGFDPRTVEPIASRYTDWSIVADGNRNVWKITTTSPTDTLVPRIRRLPEHLCPGLKRPGGNTDRSPRSSARVKNVWSYTSIPPYSHLTRTQTTSTIRCFQAICCDIKNFTQKHTLYTLVY